jgi:hypothetical protein
MRGIENKPETILPPYVFMPLTQVERFFLMVRWKMFSEDDMQKAQTYPGRYVEHFCHCRSSSAKNPALRAVSIVPLWQWHIHQQLTSQREGESLNLGKIHDYATWDERFP